MPKLTDELAGPLRMMQVYIIIVNCYLYRYGNCGTNCVECHFCTLQEG